MGWRLLTSGFVHRVVLALSMAGTALIKRRTIESRVQICGWSILIGIPVLFAIFERFPIGPIVDATGEIRIKIYPIAILAVAVGMVAIVWDDW